MSLAQLDAVRLPTTVTSRLTFRKVQTRDCTLRVSVYCKIVLRAWKVAISVNLIIYLVLNRAVSVRRVSVIITAVFSVSYYIQQFVYCVLTSLTLDVGQF